MYTAQDWETAGRIVGQIKAIGKDYSHLSNFDFDNPRANCATNPDLLDVAVTINKRAITPESKQEMIVEVAERLGR